MIDRLAAAAKAEFTKHWGTDTDPWPGVALAVVRELALTSSTFYDNRRQAYLIPISSMLLEEIKMVDNIVAADDIIALEETNGTEDKFDFSSPEDVLIEVMWGGGAHETEPSWREYTIENITVISGANVDVVGAASYEQSYGGFLDYTIKDLIDCPGPGWWVVRGVTGVYSRGDGYTSDDDMKFYFEKVEPATEEEIKCA